jgi:hypothetical protein
MSKVESCPASPFRPRSESATIADTQPSGCTTRQWADAKGPGFWPGPSCFSHRDGNRWGFAPSEVPVGGSQEMARMGVTEATGPRPKAARAWVSRRAMVGSSSWGMRWP